MLTLKVLKGLLILALFGAGIFWLVRATLRRSQDPVALRRKWAVSLILIGTVLGSAHFIGPSVEGALIMPLACVAVGVIMSLLWTPSVAGIMSSPITSAITGGSEPDTPRPLYSAARSKRLAGRYAEAVAAVEEQLQRFLGDHEGQMLLASIYAENLMDLPRAEVILQRLCNRQDVTPHHAAAALTALCDWHVRLAQDPELARQDLEQIVDRYPDSELAREARQRIAHLSTTDQILASHTRPTIALKPGVTRVGLRKEPLDIRPAEVPPMEKAARLVEHLKAHPEDNASREDLARVYADDCGRPEMAILELEQLVAAPHQPPRHVAQWLNLIADMQVRRMNDYDGAAATLQRIIDLFPNAALADNARSRLNTLKLEQRGQTKAAALTLGEYEQRLGLKGSQRRAPDRD
jgi:TolA-binding protein